MKIDLSHLIITLNLNKINHMEKIKSVHTTAN